MTERESWVDRYRPETFGELQGNNKACKQIKKWAENWDLGDEPQMLVGEPGTGKTSAAYIVSNILDLPLNKVNMSLQRRTDEIKQTARSMHSSPAGEDFQLVLLDEIDNMHGQVNKNPLYDALRSPRNPIIITANDKYDVPDPVKRACNVHDFKLGVRSRKAKIKEIADAEGLDLSPSEVNRLAQRPDLRSIINDLQHASESDVPIGEDHRTWAKGEFPAIDALLSGEGEVWREAIGYQDETFSRPSDAVLWSDENLTEEFRGLEAGLAYQILAYADYWVGTAWERQDFRFQKYAWAMLRELPEARLSEPYGGWIDTSFPQWFRSSEAKHDGGTPEAKLYQSVKGGERGFGIAGSFYEFRERHLPILQDLPEDERLEIALNHGLDADSVKALDLDPNDFEDWKEVEAPQQGDGWSPNTDSAADAGW